MNFINLKTLSYPVSIYQIRSENPQISYPESFNSNYYVPEGYALVQRSPMPDFDYRNQGVRETTPQLINDQWTQVWELYELDDETRKAIYDMKCQEIKNRRTLLLLHSDWTQIPDVPVDREAWAVYRQQLRDIPTQPGFPFDLIWPEPPGNINLPVQSPNLK